MIPSLNRTFVLNHPATGISDSYFSFPEKVLQFGTGVLLRGLVDYLIDKANKQGVFEGRVVVVKSTDGEVSEFTNQDNLYTTHIKGIAAGELINSSLVNTSISRVLQSNAEWQEILKTVHQPALQIIISNTTEVGIQYVEESIATGVPASYPGKLLAVLWERYQYFKGAPDTGFVIVPTELVVNNGQLLEEIVVKLATFNQLPAAFMKWLATDNHFCNSLVDRIVPGKPQDLPALEQQAGYTDKLWIDVEPFLLWAIEGDERVKSVLSFHQADARMLITPSITPYREQKLRILNGSHTISVPLGYLSGHNTVRECMEDAYMQQFFSNVVTHEILPTLADLGPQVADFAAAVLDRFANPFIAHKLLSITFQESSKMNARNVRTFFRYYEKEGQVPATMCLGFAAMLLFLKPSKLEDGKYYGKRGEEWYMINDDHAAIFADYWEKAAPANTSTLTAMVEKICSDTRLWEADLLTLPGFAAAVSTHLLALVQQGVKTYTSSLSKVL
jgi:tagaturonate reductase